MTTTTEPLTYQGRTAEQWRAASRTAHNAAADSFDRCDTDGYLSQWAHGKVAEENEVKAKLAETGGLIDADALFLLDGTLASTHRAAGKYGSYWVLNDDAAAALGKRFLTLSDASKGARRYNANRAKGVTVGTIRVQGYVGHGGDMVSLHYFRAPVVADLRSGAFEVVTSDDGVGQDW